MLRRCPGIVKASDIQIRIEQRLTLWENEEYDALVQDTVETALAGNGRRGNTETSNSVAKKYNSLVLDGKVRAAV